MIRGLNMHVTSLLLLLGLASAAPGDFERGNELLGQGRPAEAEIAFRSALADDPKSASARAQVGLALIQQGKFDAAVAEIEAVLAVDPGNMAATWYLGIARFKQRRDREAINAFDAFLGRIDASSPQWVGAHWFRLTCYTALLSSDGLTYDEVDRWLTSLDIYIATNAGDPDLPRLVGLRDYVVHNRPGKNVGTWQVVATDQQLADGILKLLSSDSVR